MTVCDAVGPKHEKCQNGKNEQQCENERKDRIKCEILQDCCGKATRNEIAISRP